MSQKEIPTDGIRRWFAVEFNNQAWELIESADLKPDQEDLLIHTAHASLRHWSDVGTEINKLRGEVLLATAYARIGLREQAIRHAEIALRNWENNPNGITPFDTATVYGAMLKAHLVKDHKQLPQPGEEIKSRYLEAKSALPSEDQALIEKLYQ